MPLNQQKVETKDVFWKRCELKMARSRKVTNVEMRKGTGRSCNSIAAKKRNSMCEGRKNRLIQGGVDECLSFLKKTPTFHQ